ncbi:MAG: aldehyde dehydrogenase family protein [Pseudonocardiaceae bacterium]
MRVGQAWVGPDEREAMPVIDPSTGKTIADVPVATEEDAQSALEAAQRAQPVWAALTPRERAEYLQRVAQLVGADAERLSRLISHEGGKLLREDNKYGLSAHLFSNDAKAVQRFAEGCNFGELYINKTGPEQLNGYHTGYRLSGILGDDGTHGLEKYSRRRTTYTSWRQETAADLMPFAV